MDTINPFRYAPTPAVRAAARRLIQRIADSPDLDQAFSPGKMLGVLVVRDKAGRIGYLSAFSGLAGGKSHLDGFVPPIFDLTTPEGYFRRKEKEISEVVQKLKLLENDPEYIQLKTELHSAGERMDSELKGLRKTMEVSRAGRAAERACGVSAERLKELQRQSQFEKAEYRRVRKAISEKIALLEEREKQFRGQMKALKEQHRQMSDELQRWIFGNYTVHNALGEESSIWQIFASRGLVPPGGTGECAAPKLLEYAYRNGLEPLSMGEFWYGKSSLTAVRVQGHFYPSCTSKCGPLLGFMLRGLNSHEPDSGPEKPCADSFEVLYSDKDIIVAVKNSSVPSVPGLDGCKSLLEMLQEHFGREVYPVHRLDMDTSGVMVYARTRQAQANLQQQFETRRVDKTYWARLCPGDIALDHCGTISLPLGPDYDERPRQKVDKTAGKEAITEYKCLCTHPDGTTEVLFHPLTGRTHQLRVHSAHALGLARPIAGDLLYGGALPGISRLCLHARSLSFTHPSTGELLNFESPTPPVTPVLDP